MYKEIHYFSHFKGFFIKSVCSPVILIFLKCRSTYRRTMGVKQAGFILSSSGGSVKWLTIPPTTSMTIRPNSV